MKLSECLTESALAVGVSASDKREILSTLVDLLEESDAGVDPGSLLSEVHKREKLGSTGIGKGVAIPHVHLDEITQMHVAMITTSEGIDYDAIDDEPCRIFIIVVAPDQDRETYLHLLAQVSRLFRHDEVRREVLKAETAEELLEALRRGEAV